MDKELQFNPVAGQPPSIEWLPIADLQIDESYQRSIESPASQTLIHEIAVNWDWDRFDPIRVSRREAGAFVVDGQHRLTAARLRGDLPHLPAIVSRFKDSTAEARFFVAVNTSRKNPTPLDKFRARVIAGDAEAVAIDRLIGAAGLIIGRTTTKFNDREIACVSLLGRLYRRFGDVILGGALGAMAKAFPTDGMRGADEMLGGICVFLRDPPRPFVADRLIEALQVHSQSDWVMKWWRWRNNHPEACYIEDVFAAFYREAYKAADDRHWQKLGDEATRPEPPQTRSEARAAPPVTREIRVPAPIPPPPATVPASRRSAEQDAIDRFIAQKGVTKIDAKAPLLEERIRLAIEKLAAAGVSVEKRGTEYRIKGQPISVARLLERAEQRAL